MKSFKEYLSRVGKARGFGIQSPWAYRFVTEIVGERCPYYYYETIEQIYKNRKLEDAGSMLTIRWLKPVFRCGFGFCFGCIATYCFNSMLKENDIYYKIPFAFVLAALWIFVMISVVIAEMIVRKEFKIVSKRIIYESFGFSSRI